MTKEILSLLKQLKVKYPDWRIGQIIFNATGQYDCFHVRDEDLLKGLKNLIK
jgi:hypothetical protein